VEDEGRSPECTVIHPCAWRPPPLGSLKTNLDGDVILGRSKQSVQK